MAKKSNSIVSFFENLLGSELSLANIDRLIKAKHPKRWLERIWEADEDFFKLYLPKAPYKTNEPSAIFDWQCYWDWSNENGNELDWNQMSKRVLNYLLYYPSVYIEWSPLVGSLETLSKNFTGDEYVNYLDYAVKEYLVSLRLLAILKPLILKGYINFYHVNKLHPDFFNKWMESFDFEVGLHFEKQPGIKLPDETYFTVDPSQPQDEAIWSLECIETLTEHLKKVDFLGGFPVVVDELFRRLINYHFSFIAENLSRVKLLSNAMPIFMDKINLPSLVSCKLNDLIAIRKDEYLFEAWRSSLLDIMNAVEMEFKSKPHSEDQIKSLYKDILSPKQAAIQRFVKDRSFLKLSKQEVIGFAFGMVGGLSVGGDVFSSLISGLAGSALSAARSLYINRKQIKPGEVLLKWYSAFIE